jgi:hypothetical protein
MASLHEITLADELNIDIKQVTQDKSKTTDLLRVTFKLGLQVKQKLDGVNRKINLKELSKQNEKSVAKQLKEDLENLTWMIQRKDFLKNDVDSDEALLMV